MANQTSKQLMNPLVEVVTKNEGLMLSITNLLALAELEFIDIGNQLDAVDALRDTFIYLAAKTREDMPNGKQGQ